MTKPFSFEEASKPSDITTSGAFSFEDALKPAVEPDTGFTGGFKSSAARLKGEAALTAAKLGLMDKDKAEQYLKEKQVESEQAFKPTEKSWAEAPLEKLKETAGQSAAYMAAPLAVAGGVALLPEALLGAGALGLTTAGLTGAGVSYGQFVGSNLGRQVDEGKSLDDASLLKAGAAAVPQTALDVIGFRFIPGIRNIFAKAGLDISKDVAEDVVKKSILKTAGEYTLKTGKVMGVEGLTESGQQVFERLQAGLSLTDPQARKEYFENFIGGAVLGGALSIPGQAYEKVKTKYEDKQIDKVLDVLNPKPDTTETTAPTPTPEPINVMPEDQVITLAQKRIDEIETKMNGTPDIEGIGPDGEPRTMQGQQPQLITDQERAEYDFLKQNINNASAIANTYGITIGEPQVTTAEISTPDTAPQTTAKVEDTSHDNQAMLDELSGKDIELTADQFQEDNVPAAEKTAEEPTGTITEEDKEFTPVGGRLINKADADKLARESALALQQNLAAEETEKEKQLKREIREEKFREPVTQTLSARLVQQGGIARSQKRDMLGETGKISGYDHVFRENGGDLLTMVKDGLLDDYLPPNIRSTATPPDGLFDARPGYNYISDLIGTGEKVHHYDYEMAKIQHENIVAEKNLAKQQMTPNERARVAAAEEQKKIFMSEGKVAGATNKLDADAIIRKVLGKEGQKLLDSERLKLIGTANDLDARLLAQISANTRAFYDPVTDTSYIITDRVMPDELRPMILHEVGVHYGMKRMLGDTAYKNLLANILKLRLTDKAVQDAFNTVSQTESYAKLLEDEATIPAFLEEVLAHLGETAPTHNLWKRIVQAVKTFLIKNNIIKKLSVSEVKDLVTASLRSAAFTKINPQNIQTSDKILASQVLEKVKKIAGWTNDRVEKLIRYGTYYGANSEKYAREYAVMMTPDEFLGLTTNKEMMETLEKEASELGPLDIDKMKEYDVPMYIKLKGPRTYEVENQWGSEVDTTQDAIKVNGHEGRHRAILLKRAGVEKIPVVLMPEGGGQVNRDIIRILKLFPQFDGGNEAIVRNIIPINRLHEAELKGMLRESNIKYSERPPLNIRGQEVLPQWHGPEESKIDTWLYRLQNKQIDTKRVQEAIGNIEDSWNLYEKEQLYHGRTASGIRNFLLKELLPVIKEIERLKISPQEIRTYLHNRHAEERNNQMNKINPDIYDATTGRTRPNPLKDKGSGISTADARAYLAGLDPAKKQTLENIAEKFDQMIKGTQQILVNSGAESQETINKWNKTYKHYVPLFRIEDEMAKTLLTTGTGQGFDVRGSTGKRALGSEKEVQDILSNLIAQRERALIRSEKIRVGRALYGLAIQNPNPKFWMVINPDAIKNKRQAIAELTRMGIPDAADVINNLMAEPKERYLKKVREAEGNIEPDEDFDFDSGLPVSESKEVVASKINVMARYKDYVFSVRINGKDRYIFFNKNDPRALRMVQSLKNLDVENLGFVESIAGKFTRWFKNVNTQYNPVFGLVNFVRDAGGALLNLTNTEIAGEQVKVIAGAYKAMGGILNVHRAERKGKPLPTGPWARLYQEARAEGFQTGYRDSLIRNQEEMQIIEHTLEQFKDSNTKKAFYSVIGGLTDFNDMMENAIRLSAYKVAIDKGISKQKAAIIAKNLTVNFDKKGAWTAQVNALYAFFNASVQGTERIYRTIMGPKGKMIIGGGILAGMVQAMMLAAAGYDEDDPPEFVREKNFIVPLPDGTYITIPYPLGYNILPNSGRIVMDFMIHGGRDPGKHVTSLLSSTMNSFNPLGSTGFSMQTIMPTVLDPIAALAENKDAFGRPIARKDRGTAPTPGYTRSRDTSTEISKGLSYFLNLASGGSKYQKGYVSPTADEIDFLAGQVGGGLYRETTKAGKAISSVFTGEEIPSYQRPVVGRFIGETGSQASVAQKFYENVTRMTDHENELKGRKKNQENIPEYLKDYPEARLWRKANSVENEINALNKQKRLFIEKGFPKERIQAIEARKALKMKKFNDQVKAARPD
jgi:hypothetical protein